MIRGLSNLWIRFFRNYLYFPRPGGELKRDGNLWLEFKSRRWRGAWEGLNRERRWNWSFGSGSYKVLSGSDLETVHNCGNLCRF